MGGMWEIIDKMNKEMGYSTYINNITNNLHRNDD